MDNKKWTDSDLQTAFEDSCKFINLEDLKDFLLKRRQLAASTESTCNLKNVSVSKLELFANWLKEQKHEIRGGKKMYDVRYYRWLTEDEMYEYWSQRVYSR